MLINARGLAAFCIPGILQRGSWDLAMLMEFSLALFAAVTEIPKGMRYRSGVFHYLELHCFRNLSANHISCTWYEKRDSEARFWKNVGLKEISWSLLSGISCPCHSNSFSPEIYPDPSSRETANNILCISYLFLPTYTYNNSQQSEHLNFESMKLPAGNKETFTYEAF